MLMLAESTPLVGGFKPESRDHGVDEVEAMDIELGLSTRSALSGGEEGKVHSGDKTCPEAVVQALLSANAVV